MKLPVPTILLVTQRLRLSASALQEGPDEWSCPPDNSPPEVGDLLQGTALQLHHLSWPGPPNASAFSGAHSDRAGETLDDSDLGLNFIMLPPMHKHWIDSGPEFSPAELGQLLISGILAPHPKVKNPLNLKLPIDHPSRNTSPNASAFKGGHSPSSRAGEGTEVPPTSNNEE